MADGSTSATSSPTMVPSGWFQVGWSGDLEPGQVEAKRHFGQDLVLYRSDKGGVHALDAHCGHMGAHLGVGGAVRDDCLVCPFHGWVWDVDGRNVDIPYGDRPNGSARMRSWPTAERNEILYLWHDVRGRQPSWEVPDAFGVLGAEIKELEFHPSDPDGQIRLGVHTIDPYAVLDNAADAAHFKFVHGTRTIPTVVSSGADGHLYNVRLGFGSSWKRDPTAATGERLDIVQAGVGLSYTVAGSHSTGFTAILLATTPIDDLTSELFQTVWLQRLPGDDDTTLKRRMELATSQLPRDIEIWAYQRYIERPSWTASEVREFTSIRRWAREFAPAP